MKFFKRLRVPTPCSLWRVFVCDLWFAWGTAVLIGVPSSWAYSDSYRSAEWALRIAGFLFVMAALLLVAYRLYSLRKKFVPSWTPFVPIKGWARKAVGLVWKWHTQGEADIPLGELRGSGRVATIWTGGGAGEALEKRVEALERHAIEAIRAIANARDEARQGDAALERKLRDEAKAIRQYASEGRELLEAVSVGSLKAEAVGLFWLVLGTTLSTFPVGIAKLLQRFM